MEEKYTVQTAMRWIVEQQGREIFEKELLINSILADLAAEQEIERRKIRLALSSGAGKMFYRMLLHSDGNLHSQDIRMFRTNLVDYGFTREFADYVLNTFLFSVSMPVIMETDQTRESNCNVSHQKQQESIPPDSPKPASSPEMSLEEILEIAVGYDAAQDYNREIYLLESIIDKYPNVAGIYNMLGIAYRNIGNNLQALRYYQKALSIEPENGSMQMNQAIALMMSGKVKEARIAFEKAIPILKKGNNKNYAGALGNYAYALALDGENEEAVKMLKDAAQQGYRHAEEMRRKFEEMGIYYH